jgi:mycothiol system anti-sigma-R factor
MSDQVACQRALNDLCALVDKELELARERQLREHLNECVPCQGEFHAQSSVKSLVGRSCRCEPAPSHLRVAIVTMIAQVSIVYEAPFESE